MAKRISRSKSSDETAAAKPKRPARAPRVKATNAAITAPESAADTSGAVATEVSPSEASPTTPAAVFEPASTRSTAAASMSSEPSEADIRLRAYHKFLHRHGGAGSDWDDWFAAEKELRRTSGQEKRQLS
jgi:hypothetical protein